MPRPVVRQPGHYLALDIPSERVVEQSDDDPAVAILDGQGVQIVRDSPVSDPDVKRVGHARVSFAAVAFFETEITKRGFERAMVPVGVPIGSDCPRLLGIGDDRKGGLLPDGSHNLRERLVSGAARGLALGLERLVHAWNVHVAEGVLPSRFLAESRVQQSVEIVRIARSGMLADVEVELLVEQDVPPELLGRHRMEAHVDTGGVHVLREMSCDPNGGRVLVGGNGRDGQGDLFGCIAVDRGLKSVQAAGTRGERARHACKERTAADRTPRYGHSNDSGDTKSINVPSWIGYVRIDGAWITS